jgi:hypothetical protein
MPIAICCGAPEGAGSRWCGLALLVLLRLLLGRLVRGRLGRGPARSLFPPERCLAGGGLLRDECAGLPLPQGSHGFGELDLRDCRSRAV